MISGGGFYDLLSFFVDHVGGRSLFFPGECEKRSGNDHIVFSNFYYEPNAFSNELMVMVNCILQFKYDQFDVGGMWRLSTSQTIPKILTIVN